MKVVLAVPYRSGYIPSMAALTLRSMEKRGKEGAMVTRELITCDAAVEPLKPLPNGDTVAMLVDLSNESTHINSSSISTMPRERMLPLCMVKERSPTPMEAIRYVA